MVVSSLSTRPDQRLPRHLLKATSNIVSVVLTGILHDRMLSTARAGNEHESLEKNGEEHSGLKGKTIRALVSLIGQRWDRDGRLPESKAFPCSFPLLQWKPLAAKTGPNGLVRPAAQARRCILPLPHCTHRQSPHTAAMDGLRTAHGGGRRRRTFRPTCSAAWKRHLRAAG